MNFLEPDLDYWKTGTIGHAPQLSIAQYRVQQEKIVFHQCPFRGRVSEQGAAFDSTSPPFGCSFVESS
jgi:hypothetical protein